MNKISTRKIVLNGLMIALVFLATRFTSFPGPIPPGYINFGDIVIMTAAILLGRNTGFLAGSIGSMLADISYGAFIFAPVTFIVKGLEGYIVGVLASPANGKNKKNTARVTAVVVGAAVMVIGYFIAEWAILGIFDEAFGYTAAIAELPLNLIQGSVSAVVGYIFSTLLVKANVQSHILQ